MLITAPRIRSRPPASTFLLTNYSDWRMVNGVTPLRWTADDIEAQIEFCGTASPWQYRLVAAQRYGEVLRELRATRAELAAAVVTGQREDNG